ncbi:MAG: glycogen-binding domain-containing protein [Gemmatimonadaceae bacterium]
MRVPGLIAGVALTCSLLVGAPMAGAQVWTTIDIGGAAVRYGDSLNVAATSVSPRIRAGNGALAGSAIGTLSSLSAGGWTAQGTLDFSVLSRAVGFARVELAAEAGGSLHDDATRTGEYLGRARLHAGTNGRGVWAGAAVGKTWDASLWHPVVQGDFGAWARLGQLVLVAVVTPSAVGDSLRYADAQGALRWDTRRAELTLGIGARTGDALVRDATAWGSMAAVLWLTSHVGIVASGGSYPVDYTQGYPGGRYVSLAVRFGGRPNPAAALSSRAQSVARPRAATTGPHLEITSLPNGRRALRVHAPGARSVEVMADFTAWQPLALTPASDGWWTATVLVAPGVHQLNVRVNGGSWDVPAGAFDAIDEFGARVGVLNLR